ncbi:MupG family TIM beta-alpha barrel fold protein, partial [Clostridium polynesiense]|uniref:MupG family TIM beta-alpha barrel fold protein n=1 Tax=Clostridium polynesiense TaxID=1325933 RepID=UPI00058EEE81
FLALLGVKDGSREEVLELYKKYTFPAKELGYEIVVDVNPMVFDKLGVNANFFRGPLDLSFFSDLKIDTLRLDLGMCDLEEAYLSKNKEGIKICLNGATKLDHVGHVLQAGGNPEKICGCHNYYPHRYTGVLLEHFMESTNNWVSHNLPVMTFVSSQAKDQFGPWPVTEGLPTLEMHRDWPIEIQTLHYLMMGNVDDIIIGNCFATEEELRKMAQANQEITTFHVNLVDGVTESMKNRLQMNLSVRGDQGAYLIRSLESRMMREEVEPFNTVDIHPGDVLIDNVLYGQYAGEVQIALKEMKNYGKTNVVGYLNPLEVQLLQYLKGGQPFRFVWED